MQLSEAKPNSKTPYFNKGKRYYKLGFYLWLTATLLSQLIKVLPDEGLIGGIKYLLVGLPILAEFVVVPLAIIYMIKSYGHQEPPNKYRTFYLIVLILIALFLLLLIVSVWADIRVLLNQ